MKFIKGCVYVAMVAVVLLLILFGVRTNRSYREVHYFLTNRIEGLFEDTPVSPFLRNAHFGYLRLTNRHHFNEITILTDGRMMLHNLDPNFFLYERADNIIALGDYLAGRDIPFLYVRLPSKIEDNSVLPFAFSDNQSIEYGDRLTNLISEGGVDTLDLREIMMQENMDFTTAFFRMDHHLTAETALWATSVINEYINRQHNLGIDVSVWDRNNFGSITYEQAFQGHEATYMHAYHLFEDITVLFPEFQTELIMKIGYAVAYGEFVDVFMPKVRNEHNERFNYDDMILPLVPFVSVTNQLASNDMRVLFIAESNGMLKGTFLSLGYESLHVVYIINSVTPGVLWDLLGRYDYDLVIMAVSDVVVAQESRERFHDDRLFLGYPPID